VATPTPAIPSFTDGTVVHQADLNALASNLTNLYNYNQAGFVTQRPCVFAKQTTGQSISNTTHTLVNMQSEVIDTDNMWTASVANQITIQHAGIYLLFARTRWPAISGANFNLGLFSHILVNGTAVPTNVVTEGIQPMINLAGSQTVMTMANLAVNATVYLDVWHDAGSALTLATDYGSSYFGAVFLTASS